METYSHSLTGCADTTPRRVFNASGKKRTAHPKADADDLFLCPRCNRVYTTYYAHNDKRIPNIRSSGISERSDYHPDFPRYGQEKRVCVECRGGTRASA